MLTSCTRFPSITLAIVALPIALVTSGVLFQRLVLGEERKVLVRGPVSSPVAPLHKDRESLVGDGRSFQEQ